MVMRFYVRKGDSTNAGGTVIHGSGTTDSFNQGMAYEGDSVHCPRCRSMGQIVCDGPRWSMTGMDGREAALNNDICLCKCNPLPRLLSGQGVMSMDTAGAPGSSNAAGNDHPNLPKDEQFLLRDPQSGTPLDNVLYEIRTGAGDLIRGTTDANGRTQRVKTDDPQSLTFHFFPRSQT